MAETYKVIFPGNYVNRLNAYPLPNPSFALNSRPSGFWGDRQQQAALTVPGWLAVHKVGLVKVGSALITSASPIVPSPYTRGDDKPLADVNDGLTVPKGALLYRLGLRAPWEGNEPSAASWGPNKPVGLPLQTGMVGTAGEQLVLAAALPAALNTGAITVNGGNTSNTPAPDWNNVAAGANILTVSADGKLLAGATAFTAVPGSAQAAVMANDTTFKIWSVTAAGTAAGAGVKSVVPGGGYLVAEVAYLVPDLVATLDELPLPGHQYAGYTG